MKWRMNGRIRREKGLKFSLISLKKHNVHAKLDLINEDVPCLAESNY